MAGSQETFNKKDKEKKRLKKRLEKQKKSAERKANAASGPGNMIAYVDEFGRISDTPPNPANRQTVSADSIELGVPKREMIEPAAFRNGRVEFFNVSKGFGFIKEIDTQDKYFVHATNLSEEIKEGDMVTFKIERGMKGMNAVQVKKVQS
jgi:cold shock CspA family protein